MAITINGTSGITTPELTLDNTAADGGQVVLKSAGYSSWNIDNYSGSLRAYYNATEYMRIDSSGMLGLGITPNQTSGIAMEFGGSANNNAINFLNSANCQGWITSNAYYNGTNWLRKYASGTTCTAYATNVNGTHVWYVAPASTAGSTISWTQAMTLDTSGNLLVGRTTNPWTVRLLVESTGAVTNLRTTSTTATAVEIDVNSSNTTQKAVEVYSDSNNERSLTIWSNGNVVNKNNSYGAISDIKLKENIVDATPKLEQICQIQVRNFNYIGSETKQIGVVAQELEQIFPSMIDESPDTDREGNLLETTTKSVKYSVFVPMLIKAIQEQQAIITEQSLALQDLKARVESLENK